MSYMGLGQGTPVYAESSIESGVPGVVEARQITPTGEKGPLKPIETDFARRIGPHGAYGPLLPDPQEYARRIGPHGATGPLIPLEGLLGNGDAEKGPWLSIGLGIGVGLLIMLTTAGKGEEVPSRNPLDFDLFPIRDDLTGREYWVVSFAAPSKNVVVGTIYRSAGGFLADPSGWAPERTFSSLDDAKGYIVDLGKPSSSTFESILASVRGWAGR